MFREIPTLKGSHSDVISATPSGSGNFTYRIPGATQMLAPGYYL